MPVPMVAAEDFIGPAAAGTTGGVDEELFAGHWVEELIKLCISTARSLDRSFRSSIDNGPGCAFDGDLSAGSLSGSAHAVVVVVLVIVPSHCICAVRAGGVTAGPLAYAVVVVWPGTTTAVAVVFVLEMIASALACAVALAIAACFDFSAAARTDCVRLRIPARRHFFSTEWAGKLSIIRFAIALLLADRFLDRFLRCSRDRFACLVRWFDRFCTIFLVVDGFTIAGVGVPLGCVNVCVMTKAGFGAVAGVGCGAAVLGPVGCLGFIGIGCVRTGGIPTRGDGFGSLAAYIVGSGGNGGICRVDISPGT